MSTPLCTFPPIRRSSPDAWNGGGADINAWRAMGATGVNASKLTAAAKRAAKLDGPDYNMPEGYWGEDGNWVSTHVRPAKQTAPRAVKTAPAPRPPQLPAEKPLTEDAVWLRIAQLKAELAILEEQGRQFVRARLSIA